MTDSPKFGHWSAAWMEALESGVRIDPDALAAGARNWEAVADLVVAPGEITARVLGGRSGRHVRIGVRRWTPAEWDLAIKTIAEVPAHAAAVTGGTLDEPTVATLAAAALSPMPGPADVSWDCSCGELSAPCAHQAAVAAATGRAFDSDPLALLVVRGRERVRVVEQVAAARPRAKTTLFDDAAHAAPAGIATSTPPQQAWEQRRPGDPLARPLPRPRVAPDEPTPAPAWAAIPPATEADAPTLDDLTTTVAAAAARARAALIRRDETLDD